MSTTTQAPPTPGQALRAARQAAGLSQRQLALALGLSHSMPGIWERDAARIPTRHVGTIAEVLGCDPETIESAPIKSRRGPISPSEHFHVLSPPDARGIILHYGNSAHRVSNSVSLIKLDGSSVRVFDTSRAIWYRRTYSSTEKATNGAYRLAHRVKREGNAGALVRWGLRLGVSAEESPKSG